MGKRTIGNVNGLSQMKGSEVSISVVKCSLVQCGEVWQCNDDTSNKVSNIIISHIDNRKLPLIYILLLSHSLIFFRFLFYKNMVVIYVFLLEEAMYSYCCLCIRIVSVCVFLSLSMCEVFPCFFLSCKANARV